MVTLHAFTAPFTILPPDEQPDMERLIVATARVSSNRTDLYEKPEKLLRYCIKQGHWSVFEQADLTLRIETSRAIGRELIRHGSFRFQEFSQRYAHVLEIERPQMRIQANLNRQSSTVPADDDEQIRAGLSLIASQRAYQELIDAGVARESARFVLPEATKTTLYMKGSIRSWITFLNVRLHETSQKEMRDVAQGVAAIFRSRLPIISAALNDFKGAEKVHILDQLAVVNNLHKIDEIKEFWGIE
jgi:thymidylate synthase (FAD)